MFIHNNYYTSHYPGILNCRIKSEDFAAIILLLVCYLPLGRVHSSMLSGINLDSKSATVEWFENGETKGKEVCSGKILNVFEP